MSRAGILASVLGGIAGFFGVWLGMLVFGASDQATTNFHSIMHSELALTSAQEVEIDRLEYQYDIVRSRYEQDMDQARRDIGTSLLRDESLSEEVASAATQFHNAMSGLQMETLTHILAMREQLDDEQKQDFDARLTQAFNGHD